MATVANDERDERSTAIDSGEYDATDGASPRWRKANRARRELRRAARLGTEELKCGHCRAFIGPTITGGRHRNHCPRCLHSRRVDDDRPGDRASDCRASMAPVARFDRSGGEPVIVHRCLGCGLERHNRLAADDNPMLLIWLPLVAPRVGRATAPVAASRDDDAAWEARPGRRTGRRAVS